MTNEYAVPVTSRQNAENLYEALRSSARSVSEEKAAIFDDSQFRGPATIQIELYLQAIKRVGSSQGTIIGLAEGLETLVNVLSKRSIFGSVSIPK